jgi:hypothetical protein
MASAYARASETTLAGEEATGEATASPGEGIMRWTSSTCFADGARLVLVRVRGPIAPACPVPAAASSASSYLLSRRRAGAEEYTASVRCWITGPVEDRGRSVATEEQGEALLAVARSSSGPGRDEPSVVRLERLLEGVDAWGVGQAGSLVFGNGGVKVGCGLAS